MRYYIALLNMYAISDVTLNNANVIGIYHATSGLAGLAKNRNKDIADELNPLTISLGSMLSTGIANNSITNIANITPVQNKPPVIVFNHIKNPIKLLTVGAASCNNIDNIIFTSRSILPYI